MGKQETTFDLQITLADAEKQLADVEGARPGVPGVPAPGGIPGAPTAAPEAPTAPLPEPELPGALETLKEGKDRIKNIASTVKGLFSESGFISTLEKGIRAVPGIGGIGALAFFAAMNAEQFAFISEPFAKIPGGGLVNNLVEKNKDAKSLIQATGRTLGDATNIAKAFGSIGDLPEEAGVTEALGGLFGANRAQASFQINFNEQLLRSQASTMQKAVTNIGVTELLPRLFGSFTGGIYK